MLIVLHLRALRCLFRGRWSLLPCPRTTAHFRTRHGILLHDWLDVAEHGPEQFEEPRSAVLAGQILVFVLFVLFACAAVPFLPRKSVSSPRHSFFHLWPTFQPFRTLEACRLRPSITFQVHQTLMRDHPALLSSCLEVRYR